MTEAFEIGVSLALQDGVSDAIGKARRDVAALGHAVRESGVSLRSLREVGAKAASVSFGDHRREVAAGPARRAAQALLHDKENSAASLTEVARRVDMAVPPALGKMAPLRSAPGVAPASDGDRATQAETEAAPGLLAASLPASAPLGDVAPWPRTGQVQEAAPAMPGEDAREGEPLARPMPDPAPRAPTPLNGSVVEASAAVAPKMLLAPLEGMGPVTAPVGGAVAADSGVGGEAVSLEGMAPIAASLQVMQAAPPTRPVALQWPAPSVLPAIWETTVARDAPPPEESAPLHRDAEHGSLGPMSLLSALRVSGGSAAMTRREDPATRTVNDASAFNDDSATENAPPASVSTTTPPNGASPVGVAAAGAKAQNTLQQADSRDAGPHMGDVFLDGMLVGRWMSRFLNREAERASAGPTGFDARRGRLLPGATVGG